MERLYVVVRSDLSTGLQLAQACHATRLFGQLFPSEEVGENLVVLHAASKFELAHITERVGSLCRVAEFREPDLDNELTAIAFSGLARKLVSTLPLAA